MNLVVAWVQCRDDQFIVRQSMPDWGIEKTNRFKQTITAAAGFGQEFVVAEDWMVVDVKPLILGDPTTRKTYKPGPGFSRVGW